MSEQDEIYGVKTINWEYYSWKYLSLIGDEQVISLQRTKVYVFSDSVLCLGKIHEKPQSNDAWEDRLTWFKSSSEYRTLDRIDGEPMEFEWNISHDSPHCSSATKSRVTVKIECNTRVFHRTDYLHVDVLTTSHGDQETMKKNASQMLDSPRHRRRDLEQDNGHFSVLVQRKSGILSVQIVHKVTGTQWQRR